MGVVKDYTIGKKCPVCGEELIYRDYRKTLNAKLICNYFECLKCHGLFDVVNLTQF